ncbi:MAG TPA: DCC1-like thiol-disulfide oxidoreductase family protein [Candidatus Glassbacteria bacterium]|nr:DCC1-like thiol-disulfide oxidoreductase family protein [Candidatus Glassbacteria bacterium]
MRINPHPDSIVFFDGFCNLCGGFARWLVHRDRRGVFRLAPLGGETAGKLLSGCAESVRGADSIILLEQGCCFTRSTAVLKILKGLRAPWPLLYLFIVIPRPVRDFVYDIIARLRYRLFGRRDKCWTADEILSGRLLP